MLNVECWMTDGTLLFQHSTFNSTLNIQFNTQHSIQHSTFNSTLNIQFNIQHLHSTFNISLFAPTAAEINAPRHVSASPPHRTLLSEQRSPAFRVRTRATA